MKLRISKRWRAEFRRHAIEEYEKPGGPFEAYAVMLGHKNGDTWEVVELHFPAVRATYDEEYFRVYYAEALTDAKHEADADHLEILGDIHSHPQSCDASPGEADLDLNTQGLIQGICAIYKPKNTKQKFRVHFRFWGEIPRVFAIE